VLTVSTSSARCSHTCRNALPGASVALVEARADVHGHPRRNIDAARTRIRLINAMRVRLRTVAPAFTEKFSSVRVIRTASKVEPVGPASGGR
jgi:hypothetical protein